MRTDLPLSFADRIPEAVAVKRLAVGTLHAFGRATESQCLRPHLS